MWTGTKDQIELVLIRHGKTKENEEHRYLGRTDSPLSENGAEELRNFVREQLYPSVEAVFASPMIRCVQTAKIIYPDLQPVCVPDLREMDFGLFEGKDNPDYRAWIDQDGNTCCSKGEGKDAFIKRSMEGFLQAMKQAMQQARAYHKIGMVVHGGTIMAVLSQLAGGNYYDYQVKNGKGYVCFLQYEDEKWKVQEIKPL